MEGEPPPPPFAFGIPDSLISEVWGTSLCLLSCCLTWVGSLSAPKFGSPLPLSVGIWGDLLCPHKNPDPPLPRLLSPLL